MTSLLISTADASGDAHAADFSAALRERIPGLHIFGIGGRALARAGVEITADQADLAATGLVEALGSLPRGLRAVRAVLRRSRECSPALAVLIDSPDLNLPLAIRLRRLGIPVLYYVGPQVWAWRAGRTARLARRADRLAVIFPFEGACYTGTGLAVDFVGHPSLDRLIRHRASQNREQARIALRLHPQRQLLALLPGSRPNEIRSNLPVQLAALRSLRRKRPELLGALAAAPAVDPSVLTRELARCGAPAEEELQVVPGRSLTLIRAADVVLAKPGTAALETTVLGRPLVLAARTHPLTALGLRCLVRLGIFLLPDPRELNAPNLIAGFPVVPSFLQEDARPERIAEAVYQLLEGPVRALQLERLARVTAAVAAGGAARRVAAIAENMIRAQRVVAA